MAESVHKNKLVVVLGPTAVGKTALAVELAAALDGEIISGDSMQVYRYMDIGTAKVTEADKYSSDGRYISHHLIDILTPDQPYSVADFQQAAARLVTEINQRGKVPILAGGTGLYVTALIDGYTLGAEWGEDPVYRHAKQLEFDRAGGDVLWQELAAIDPTAAGKISSHDAKRMIRALEIYHLTGKTLTECSEKNPPDWDITLIGLQRERAELYRRIDARVITMLEAGFLDEVRSLLERGYASDLNPMQGLGYRQLGQHLAGELSYEEAVSLIQRDTRRFAKRQLTWWRRREDIHWFDLTAHEQREILPQIVELCR